MRRFNKIKREKYTVKNFDDLAELSVDDIKNFHLNMIENECVTFNPLLDEGGNVGGNKEVLSLIIKKELGSNVADPLNANGSYILEQIQKIDSCMDPDNYIAAINNIKKLDANIGSTPVTDNEKQNGSVPNDAEQKEDNEKQNGSVPNDAEQKEDSSNLEDNEKQNGSVQTPAGSGDPGSSETIEGKLDDPEKEDTTSPEKEDEIIQSSNDDGNAPSNSTPVSQTPEVTPSQPQSSDNEGGWMIVLAVIAVIAISIAIYLCVYIFKKQSTNSETSFNNDNVYADDDRPLSFDRPKFPNIDRSNLRIINESNKYIAYELPREIRNLSPDMQSAWMLEHKHDTDENGRAISYLRGGGTSHSFSYA